MKSVTEFPSHMVKRGVEIKAELEGQGKTPEEIQASLGEAFKIEGDRLKHFFNSLDVAAKNVGLSRMRVVTLAEGESAPPKSVAIEEHHYVPEFLVLAQPRQPERGGKGRGRGGGGGGGGRGGRGGPGGGGGRGMSWGDPPAPKGAKPPQK
ncbi:MAG TPA: hypothetical protein VFX30_09790 [bacterium]|nr:hypothetical protein [bacterium]